MQKERVLGRDLFVHSFTGLGFSFELFSPLDLVRILSLQWLNLLARFSCFILLHISTLCRAYFHFGQWNQLIHLGGPIHLTYHF